MLAFMILFLPLQWIGAIIFSCMTHELCHFIAARMAGVHVIGLRIGADGLYLETEEMTPKQDAICAMAGPLGGLLLLLLARWLPRTAMCAVFQSCYHLLPVLPLDGGRALHSLTELFCARNGNTVCMIIEFVTLGLLGALGVYLTVWLGMGFVPILLCIAMIFRVCREKLLAKQAGKGYNISTNS